MNESVQKAKIKWHARRGMLELDMVLASFLKDKLNTLSVHQLNCLEALLQFSDPALYACLIDGVACNQLELVEIIDAIRNHHSHS